MTVIRGVNASTVLYYYPTNVSVAALSWDNLEFLFSSQKRITCYNTQRLSVNVLIFRAQIICYLNKHQVEDKDQDLSLIDQLYIRKNVYFSELFLNFAPRQREQHATESVGTSTVCLCIGNVRFVVQYGQLLCFNVYKFVFCCSDVPVGEVIEVSSKIVKQKRRRCRIFKLERHQSL